MTAEGDEWHYAVKRHVYCETTDEYTMCGLSFKGWQTDVLWHPDNDPDWNKGRKATCTACVLLLLAEKAHG